MSSHHHCPSEQIQRKDLSEEQVADLQSAMEARAHGHAPYSRLLVGVCIRTNDNQTFKGWNTENIVYDGIHAEENALGSMTLESRETGIKSITLVGDLIGEESDNVVTPCGGCRQKLLEFIKPGDNPEVLMAAMQGDVVKVSLLDLLPFAFFPATLQK